VKRVSEVQPKVVIDPLHRGDGVTCQVLKAHIKELRRVVMLQGGKK